MSFTSIGSFNSGLWKGGGSTNTVSGITVVNYYTEAYISWNAVRNATGYQVSVTGGEGGNSYTTANTYQLFTGLTDGTIYAFTITANVGGSFGPIEQVPFTTLTLPTYNTNNTGTVNQTTSPNGIDSVWTFTEGSNVDFTIYSDIGLNIILVGKGGDADTYTFPVNTYPNNFNTFEYTLNGANGGDIAFFNNFFVSKYYSYSVTPSDIYKPTFFNPSFFLITVATNDSVKTSFQNSFTPSTQTIQTYTSSVENARNPRNAGQTSYSEINTNLQTISGSSYFSGIRSFVTTTPNRYIVAGGGGAGGGGAGGNGTSGVGGARGSSKLININNINYGPYSSGGGACGAIINTATNSLVTFNAAAGGSNGTANTGNGAGANNRTLVNGSWNFTQDNKGGSGTVVIVGTTSLLPSVVSGFSYGNLVGNATTNSYSVDVSYNQSVNNVTGYCIQFNGNVKNTTSGLTGNSFVFNSPTKLTNNYSGLNGNTAYTITAYTIGTYGNSAITNITIPQLTLPPTNLIGNTTTTTNNSISFSFTPPTTIVSSYIATAIDVSNSSLIYSNTITGNTTSATITGLASGNFYNISMKSINTYGISLSSGNLVYRTTVSKDASGGSITFSGGYKIHTFTYTGSNQSFIVQSGITSVNILVVGGGGGGGSSGLSIGYGAAGGGGGGMVKLNSNNSISNGTYTISVGNGGAGGTVSAPMNSNNNAKNGGNSSISGTSINIVALGGGYGGIGSGVQRTVPSGNSGGNGGGAGAGSTTSDSQPLTGGSANGGGNNGGNGYYLKKTPSNKYFTLGGGGGGAGQIGGNYSGSNETYYPGNGGNGVSISIGGNTTYYGGGGGGSGYLDSTSTTYLMGRGGLGGGGNAGSVGVANTGGGGGAMLTGSNSGSPGFAGGSGVVIVYYTYP